MLPTSILASKHPSMLDALGWLLQISAMVTPYWHAKHLAFLWSWQQPFPKCTQKKISDIKIILYFWAIFQEYSWCGLKKNDKFLTDVGLLEIGLSSKEFWISLKIGYALQRIGGLVRQLRSGQEKKQNLGTLTISSLFDNSEEKKRLQIQTKTYQIVLVNQ